MSTPTKDILTPKELQEWNAAREKRDAAEEQLKARLDDAGRELLWEYSSAAEEANFIEDDGIWHETLRKVPRYFPGQAPAILLALLWVRYRDEPPTCCTAILEAAS